jgi:dihydroflavonol-4-reductase
MLGKIAELTGRRAPRIRLPRAPLYPIAYATEAMARVTGCEPMLTVDTLEMSKHQMFFSSAKAERELGYAARPYGAALADAVNWFRTAGYIK